MRNQTEQNTIDLTADEDKEPDKVLAGSSMAPLNAGPSASVIAQAQSSTNTGFNRGNEDPFQLTGKTEVARFLNACSPPMGRFLNSFISHGCSSERRLRKVSTWRTDRITQFLSKVSAHGTELERLILQEHLVSYFGKAHQT